MKFGKYGVFAFTDPLDQRGLSELCKRSEEMGYSTLWYPEAFNYETFATTAYIFASQDLLEAAAVPALFLITIASIFILLTSKYILRDKNE